MTHDPFGNLNDWSMVLKLLEELGDEDRLKDCQPGLIRILQYKGNWRLREEVLKRAGEIQNPSTDLVFQILTTLADDNLYYDARNLAGDALIQLMKTIHEGPDTEIIENIRKVVQKLRSTPQPPFLYETLNRIHTEVDDPQPCIAVR